jgi:hypothetical protein
MPAATSILVCAVCGTKNRLVQGRAGRPIRGKCGSPLSMPVAAAPSVAPISPQPILPGSSRTAVSAGWLLWVAGTLIVLGAGINAIRYTAPANVEGGASPPTQSPPWTKYAQPPGAPPPTARVAPPRQWQTPGVMYNQTGRAELAPLTLVTSSGADYYVKLLDPQTKADELGIYVRGGHSLEVEVPIGEYEVHYAAGEAWYGIARRFGQDTVYFRATPLFSFTATNDGYSGYTIELILQPNGNLPTTQIGAAEF